MTDVLCTSDPKSKVIRKELDIGGLKTCLPLMSPVVLVTPVMAEAVSTPRAAAGPLR